MYISALCQRRDSLVLLKSRDYSKPRVLQNCLSTYLINLRYRYDNWDWPSQKQEIHCSSSNKITIVAVRIKHLPHVVFVSPALAAQSGLLQSSSLVRGAPLIKNSANYRGSL
jgi:hypothetical protein